MTLLRRVTLAVVAAGADLAAAAGVSVPTVAARDQFAEEDIMAVAARDRRPTLRQENDDHEICSFRQHTVKPFLQSWDYFLRPK
jgi:hypothetical protein